MKRLLGPLERLAAVGLVMGGCSLDYGPAEVTADQVPLMVFTELKQTRVEDGSVAYSVESKEAEVYASKNQMRLKDFGFREYDSTGLEVSTGTAEAAIIDTATNDATLTGTTRVRSTERDIDLTIEGGTGGTLTWKNDDRILKSGPDALVRLQKADGSRVEARGLTLDLGSNRLELEVGVQGTWTPDSDQNTTDPLPSDPPSRPRP